MNFVVRKRRAPTIIIVSLVDILIILLIFFVVSTTFKKDQPEVQINLPESKTATRRPAELEHAIVSVDHSVWQSDPARDRQTDRSDRQSYLRACAEHARDHARRERHRSRRATSGRAFAADGARHFPSRRSTEHDEVKRRRCRSKGGD